MNIFTIASGSSGNCIYVGDGNTHILIDAGVSRKRIAEGLREAGVRPEELDAIFVTHEHIDHIQGVQMMVKQFGVPVFATGGTLDGICQKDKKGILAKDKLYQLYADQEVKLGSMKIMPYRISHDAAEPVGYTVMSGGKKLGIATDLGTFDAYTTQHLEGCDVLLLEANHDISMLEAGSYPYQLKRRILSDRGHLSNEASGQLLCKLFHKRLKYAFLAHLSKENNYPMLAYEAVKCQIWEETGMRTLPFELKVAERDRPSQMVVV